MSLAIHTNLVTDVLLDDGWHAVVDRSFDIDCYEYVVDYHRDFPDYSFKQHLVQPDGVDSGATWCEGGEKGDERHCCPLASIKAVRMRRPTKKERERASKEADRREGVKS